MKFAAQRLAEFSRVIYCTVCSAEKFASRERRLTHINETVSCR